MRICTWFVLVIVLVGCSRGNVASPPLPPIGNTVSSNAAQRSTSALEPAAVTFKSLYSFKGGASDGEYPLAALLNVNGTLYGTTEYGTGSCGSAGCGTVFKISTSGAEKVLYSFKGGTIDGANPFAGLTELGGILYGTTAFAGAYANGTVFKLTTSGTEHLLHSFSANYLGYQPVAGLLAVNGTLYGTTQSGRYDTAYGTAFKITTSGAEGLLYSFTAPPNGNTPKAGLLDVSNTLYGTTWSGGTSNNGTVYKLSTSGSESVLYRFAGYPKDGAAPLASLIDVAGTLYGTTTQGGADNYGTVFKITTSGTEQVIHSFTGQGKDGVQPRAALIDVAGTLYGTTCQGGVNGDGTVFKISTSGAEGVLHSFTGADGSCPSGSLIEVSGTLYGTTSEGGAHGDGTVFAITP